MLALKPGVHMIDTLTLTDVATSFSVNLRYLADDQRYLLDPTLKCFSVQ